MFAVIPNNPAIEDEIYIFNDEETAYNFVDWLLDTDPANDGTLTFRQSYAKVIPISTPPEHWNKNIESFLDGYSH